MKELRLIIGIVAAALWLALPSEAIAEEVAANDTVVGGVHYYRKGEFDMPDSPETRDRRQDIERWVTRFGDADTAVAVSEVVDSVPMKKIPRDWSTWRPIPKKATLWALVPGGGQIYNRKFWKLPIIYGGMVGCIYAWRWNNQMYSDYRNAYMDLMDDDPNTHSYDKMLHLGTKIDETNKSTYQDVFRRRKDYYRRYRDLSIFCLVGVYALSIIDAYIDASLSEFDITKDISMKLEPAVLNDRSGRDPLKNGALGVQCSFTF